jgi:nucleotide-binding universal stress UspA family protein
MYKNILVAFDDSEFSKAALKEASLWVMKHGGKVILTHAVNPDREGFGISKTKLKGHLEKAKKLLDKTGEAAKSDYGIDIEPILIEGEPSDVILDVAKEKKADLISMGTYGRRSLKRLILGSVTSHVVINAPCDVLVVKKYCSECIGRYDSITLPFDGSEFSRKALSLACQLSKIDNAGINAVYVIPRYEEMVEFFMTDSIRESLMKESQKIIDAAVKIAEEDGLSIKTEILEGHAGDKIIEASDKQKNNLIVIGTHGWRGINKAIMGSTSERILINATCPVLLVK